MIIKPRALTDNQLVEKEIKKFLKERKPNEKIKKDRSSRSN